MTAREANADLLAEIAALRDRVASLTRENTDLQGALAQASQREAATSEILQVISGSPIDVQPVFENIAASALRLCVAKLCTVFRFDGKLIHLVALHQVSTEGAAAYRDAYPAPPGRSGGTHRAILTRSIVHIPDIREDPEYELQALAHANNFGCVLSVPMLRDGQPVGAITVGREAGRPFSDEQIELLKTFAAQALIAVENVRLLSETKEALEQQTATSEILRVISQSPTDVQPVLDAMAESAARLCEAFDSAIFRRDVDRLVLVAHHGPILVGRVGEFSLPLVRGTAAGRTVVDGLTVHVADMQIETEAFPESSENARRMGFRTILSVPLLREGIAIGTMQLRRTDARFFTDRQVALLQTFADQAVIAIENVRLFNETKEALERQTATSEILRVISQSPTDVQPVFDAIAETAARLCESFDCIIWRQSGNRLVDVAHHGPIPIEPGGLPLTRESVPGRAALEGKTFHLMDLQAQANEFPVGSDVARRLGFRTTLNVPLMRDAAAIGVITVRRTEVKPFSERQVALLNTFADQAVIAIENVRLFTELQTSNRELTTALDTQTATSDILRVISLSQTDVQPVFDAIVTSAVKLLRGFVAAMSRIAGDRLELAAFTNSDSAGEAAVRSAFPQLLDSGWPHSRVVRDRVVLNVTDARSDPQLPEAIRNVAVVRGYQSLVVLPILRHDDTVGAISVTRREPGGFTHDEITLLKTFADQAVIAIENVRLFTELQEKNRALTEAHAQVTESLEQQTAMSDILKAIASSSTDLAPVFDAICRSAIRLCGAYGGLITSFDGTLVHLAAVSSPNPDANERVRREYPRRPDAAAARDRAILERAVVHIPDTDADSEYTRQVAREFGYRRLLYVPMLRDGQPIGSIGVSGGEPGPYTEQQIELLKTFADQAVIAIENVRLFTELEASNRELTTALDKQTATSDILRVISRSQTDVQPVFDAILSSAVRLLGAYTGALTRIMDGQIELAAATRTDAAGDAAIKAAFPQPLQSEWPHAQAIRDRAPLNIADAQTDLRLPEAEHARARVRGFRSRVLVPLLRQNEAVGAISVARREPGGFKADEIALLQTFADQAVIAIENARLLTELQSRTDQLTRSVNELTALSEVGQAISSTLDLQTVLSTIAARATHLSGTDAGVIYEYDESREVFVPRATEHLEPEIVATMLATPVRRGEGATGRLAELQEPIQVPDILAAPAESRVRGALVRAGYRALLAIPLVREGHLLGGLTVIRKVTGAFAPETIELLQTFATQSSLAIQNARLFRELADKSRQLEVASHHKSEFLANMSHELRTPLNAIIGFSEVLTDRMFGELNEKQEEYLKDIYASGTHLLSLINDILDLSKIEAGRMELELTDFHLPTALDNALTLVRERAGRRNINLQMSIDNRLGEIQADERKIRQVVLNLLSNAIKFTPEGGRVEVTAVPKDGCVEVSVSDTGVGIAPEDQEKVFEEFRQVGTADKKAEGTGLGLTLCRKFIELHGGRIWVKSQLGAGSTFTFTIPVRRGE
jgi:GAF domain-containing protein